MHINVFYITNFMLQILDSVHHQIFKVHTSDAESASSNFCSFSEMAGHLKPVSVSRCSSESELDVSFFTYGFYFPSLWQPQSQILLTSDQLEHDIK